MQVIFDCVTLETAPHKLQPKTQNLWDLFQHASLEITKWSHFISLVSNEVKTWNNFKDVLIASVFIWIISNCWKLARANRLYQQIQLISRFCASGRSFTNQEDIMKGLFCWDQWMSYFWHFSFCLFCILEPQLLNEIYRLTFKPHYVFSNIRTLSLRSLKEPCWPSSSQASPTWPLLSPQVAVTLVWMIFLYSFCLNYFYNLKLLVISLKALAILCELNLISLYETNISSTMKAYKDSAFAGQVPALWETRPEIRTTRWATRWTAPTPPASSDTTSPSARRAAANSAWWTTSR